VPARFYFTDIIDQLSTLFLVKTWNTLKGIGLVIALRSQTPKHIRAAGHITLTPVNQLLVMGQIIWSLTNPGFEPATFQSLAQRSNHNAPWTRQIWKCYNNCT
jgi:hypothetical protein